jgi:hypothetical protein
MRSLQRVVAVVVGVLLGGVTTSAVSPVLFEQLGPHPRLLADSARWRELEVQIKEDPISSQMAESVLLKRGDAQTNASIHELNTRLRAYCADEKVDYVDVNAVLTKDGELRAELTQEGTHLLPEAYPLWAGQLQKTLAKLGY